MDYANIACKTSKVTKKTPNPRLLRPKANKCTVVETIVTADEPFGGNEIADALRVVGNKMRLWQPHCQPKQV